MLKFSDAPENIVAVAQRVIGEGKPAVMSVFNDGTAESGPRASRFYGYRLGRLFVTISDRGTCDMTALGNDLDPYGNRMSLYWSLNGRAGSIFDPIYAACAKVRDDWHEKTMREGLPAREA